MTTPLKPLLLAMVAAAFFAAWTPPAALRGQSGEGISDLDLVVRTAAGRVVELHFSVRASNDIEAHAAVSAALGTMLPGAVPVSGGEDGTVSAQYTPWGWRWSDEELPVKVAYNPTGAAAFVGLDAISGAVLSWNGVAGSRFAFQYAGFTDHGASLSDGGPDGENVIAWRQLDCTLGCVLGVTTKDDVVHEVDIVLNSNLQAGLGDGKLGMLDTQSVLLHEVGHMVGLGHSCSASDRCTPAEEDAIMFYRYRGIKRTLRPDDVAGLAALYPKGPGPAPVPTGVPQEPPLPHLFVMLWPGWNLAVLPAGLVDDLAGSLPCMAAVYSATPAGWDAWIRGAAPPLQSLATTDESMAYWVFAAGSCGHAFGSR